MDICENHDCQILGPNVIPIEEIGQPVDELANTGMDPLLGLFAVLLLVAGVLAIIRDRCTP